MDINEMIMTEMILESDIEDLQQLFYLIDGMLKTKQKNLEQIRKSIEKTREINNQKMG